MDKWTRFATRGKSLLLKKVKGELKRLENVLAYVEYSYRERH